MIKNTTLFFCIAVLFIVSSCNKDECEQGIQGPQGPAGSNGTNGQNGTGDVKIIEFTLNQSDWIHYNTSGNGNDSAAYNISEITQAIVDSGAVICYRKQGSNYWVMPNSTFNGLAQRVFQHYFYKETLVITCNANSVGGLNLGTETFKVIIIAGEFLRTTGKNLNWKDYDGVSSELQKYYNQKTLFNTIN
jgi:hypothetical protein